jgi:hypothetical protein
MRRQRHLQTTKEAVLVEQARQVMAHERNAELLARHCAFSSQRARSFAAMLGRADEYVAQDFP